MIWHLNLIFLNRKYPYSMFRWSLIIFCGKVIFFNCGKGHITEFILLLISTKISGMKHNSQCANITTIHLHKFYHPKQNSALIKKKLISFMNPPILDTS